MTEQISLHSIDIDNQTYFIQVHFEEEFNCSILLTNAAKTWKCDVEKPSIATFAKETRMATNEYYSLLKAALTGKPFHQDFHFSVSEETEEKLTLEWKRVKKEVKFCLGTFIFEMSSGNNATMKSILSTCCKNSSLLSQSLEAKNKDYDDLKKQCDTLQGNLEKCVKLKENLEMELMAKFVLVINEKKAKIRSLQKQLANSAPIDTTQASSSMSEKTKAINSEAKVQAEGASSSKPAKLKLEDSFDGEPVLPKRKRTTKKQPLTLCLSPVKTKETPVSPVKFPSDCTGTSSDSTVDVNELLDEM